MKDTIILGGGCFWCIEAVMQRQTGVLHVQSGYAGGHVQEPSYQQVCSGQSGHAEVVKVVFDADSITLTDILDLFFRAHDATTPNRQGNDIGPQYRSFIGCSAAQLETVQDYIKRWQAETGLNATTEIQIDPIFYPAEAEHQDYYNQHRRQPYCQWVIAPKLKKLGYEQ